MSAVAMPKWKRGDLNDHVNDYLYSEAILERRFGDTLQIIERVRVSPTSAYERSSYRVSTQENGHPAIPGPVFDTLKQARSQADTLARSLS